MWFDAEGKITCPNCGYKWKPKGGVPKQCPSCKRYLRSLNKDKLPGGIVTKPELNEVMMRLERLEQEVFKKQRPNITVREVEATREAKQVEQAGITLCLKCMEYHKDGMKKQCLPVKLGLTNPPTEECQECKYYENVDRLALNGGEM